MKHRLQGLDARTACNDVVLVCGLTQRLFDEPLGPLTQLRLHCLRERLHVLLEVLDGFDQPGRLPRTD